MVGQKRPRTASENSTSKKEPATGKQAKKGDQKAVINKKAEKVKSDDSSEGSSSESEDEKPKGKVV